jgi:hypothetical protein
MRHSFMVSLNVPEGCTIADVKSYLLDCASAWKGSLDPQDPLFGLDGDSVSVRSIPRKHRTPCPACGYLKGHKDGCYQASLDRGAH